MPAKLKEADTEVILRQMETIGLLFDTMQLRRKHICLCQNRLYLTLVSWRHDMNRMAEFHQITNPEEAKRAAFMAYWIAKMQPIQQNPCLGNPDGDMTQLQANGELALLYAFSVLEIKPKGLRVKVMRNMLYTLLFRNISPEHMALTFSFMQEAYVHGGLRP